MSMKFQLLIKTENMKDLIFLALRLLTVFILLMNAKKPTIVGIFFKYIYEITTVTVKMLTIVGILTFLSRINFMFSWVVHENSFVTSWNVYLGNWRTLFYGNRK